jgi:hypothetical protein
MKEETKIPKEKIKEDIETILKGKYPEEAVVTLGENRNQLFVRIPKIVSKRLHLAKGQKLLFKVYTEEGKQKVEISTEK